MRSSSFIPHGNAPPYLRQLQLWAEWETTIILWQVHNYRLKELNHQYELPDTKAKIDAYCDACGVEPRDAKRDYGNAEVGNLNAPALDPLKEFLRSLELE